MFGSPDWGEVLLGRKSIEEFWYAIGPELGLNSAEEIEAFRSRYRADEAINEGVLKLIRRLRGSYKLAVPGPGDYFVIIPPWGVPSPYLPEVWPDQ